MAEYICPHCKRPIHDDDALLCLYCGESLNRGAGTMGTLKHPIFKTIITALVIFVILCFILLILR